MLKVQYDASAKNLYFTFDQPLPLDLAETSEPKSFFEGLTSRGGARSTWENQALVALSVSADGWLSFIKTLANGAEYDFQQKVLAHLARQIAVPGDECLEVNFHQKPFDSVDRYWKFILHQGHFAEYFLNRVNWYLGPKNGLVSPFPLHVDLESASTCNMNCPMCYRRGLKDTGQMDVDLFKSTVDECAANHVFSVRLSWRGETLTHPNIKEMIAYAARHIPNVSFLTNAFYIDEEMADCFIENKVSYISVSFDGIGETYEKVRHPARFEDSYGRLAMLKQKKEAAGSRLPQVRVCTIWPAISDHPQKYYDTMSKVADYVVFNPYINFMGPIRIKEDFICQYPWERMVIGYNGDAQCCTGWNADDIILGNIREKSIKEMWQSDQMNDIRRLHAAGRRMDLHSCAQCRHGAQGDPDITIDEILERKH